MNYELAKQLQESGFYDRDKQNVFNEIEKLNRTAKPDWYSKYYAINWLTEDGHFYTGGNEPHLRTPTLSELIEACGTWIDLYGKGEMWSATDHTAQENTNIFHGSTPEEAVANLYLALQRPMPQQ